MPAAVVRTVEELLQRRTELLAKVGMTQEELYERAEVWALSQPERNIYETIRSINYLLRDE